MGDRFERRNPLVDQAVDVDGAVVKAPPPPTVDEEPDEGLEALPDDLVEAAGEPVADEPDEDEELEEPDGRFARRNPLIERSLGDR